MTRSVPNLNNAEMLQMVRAYARQDIPGLLACCAHLIREVPTSELGPYAAAIAEEACVANTIHVVVRALTIDHEVPIRAFAGQVLQYCQTDDELLLGLAQWLATDGNEMVEGAAFRVLGRWFQPRNAVYKLTIDMLHSPYSRPRQAAMRILSNTSVDSGAVQALLSDLQGVPQDLSRVLVLISETQMRAGAFAAALETARAIPEDKGQAEALRAIAHAAALETALVIPEDRGRTETLRAMEEVQRSAIAESRRTSSAIQKVEDKNRTEALRAIVEAQARAGAFGAALETARAIPEDRGRTEALRAIVEAQARAGAFGAALETARAIPKGRGQTEALLGIAEVQAQAGAYAAALETAQTIPKGRGRTEALWAIVEAQARAGAFGAALETAQTIPEDRGRTEALRTIVEAQARAGAFGAALETAQTIPEDRGRTEALRTIVEAQARAGAFGAALETAQTIPEDRGRTEALRAIVEAQARAGAFGAALETAQTIPEDRGRTEALRAIVEAQARAGAFDAALETAQTIPEDRGRTEALVIVAEEQMQAGHLGAVEALLLALQNDNWEMRQSAAQALGRVGRGTRPLLFALENLAGSQNVDLRHAACLTLNLLIAMAPGEIFLIAERNLYQAGPSREYRAVLIEIIGRCAFMGVQAAVEIIRTWSQSQDASQRIISAILLGELLPLGPKDAIGILGQLARDGNWTVREAVALPLVRHSLFCSEAAAGVLRIVGEDDEMAVVFAAATAFKQLTGERNYPFPSNRFQYYIRSSQRSQFVDRLLSAMLKLSSSSFAPFILTRRFFDPIMFEELLKEQESLQEGVGERGRPFQDIQGLPRPRHRYMNSGELCRLLNNLDFKSFYSTIPQLLETLDWLLQLLPDPLIFYGLYKQAPDEISCSVCCLFYELASLVEQIESPALFRDRKEARLCRPLPEVLERLACGFQALHQLGYGHEYTVLFLFLRHALMASSLHEILQAIATSKKELDSLAGQQPIAREERGLKSFFERLAEAVSALRQYSEWAPLSLRTVPLSETISHLEETTRFIDLEGTEPYRTILTQILTNWRELLRLEIRRLEGKARLEFSTLEEVIANETLTVVLEIRNRGRAPASNLQVRLTGEGLTDFTSDVQTLPSLAANESSLLTFTIHNETKQFKAEFVVTYDDLLAQANEQRYTAFISVRAAPQRWQYIRNPYLPGTPGLDLKEFDRLFVGREDVLHFIEDNLVGAAAERIVVLYGHRRTGKTWTLLRLQERLLPTTYLPVYIDVQEFTGVRGVPPLLQIFADEILRTLEEHCALDATVLAAIREPTLEQYKDNYPYYFKRVFLRDVQQVLGDRKLLWLFDEFQGLDDMVIAGNLPATFMEFLRDLMQFGKKMAFIFAGTREMTGQYWSVFFNIAVHRKIGAFNDTESEKLIVEPVRPFGVELDRFAVPLIQHLTGKHPYFIQLLCDKVVSELNARHQMLVNAQIIEAATDDLASNGASNLKFYWTEVMDEKERAIAGAMQEILRRRQPADVSTIWSEMSAINPRLAPNEVSRALNSLTEKDLLEKDMTALDTYKFKIGLVERYISAHVPYAETQGRIGKLW